MSILIWQFMNQNPPTDAEPDLQVAWKWVTEALTSRKYNKFDEALKMLEVLKKGALNNGLINNYSINEISLEIEPDKPSLLLVRFIDKEIYCALQLFTQHFERFWNLTKKLI